MHDLFSNAWEMDKEQSYACLTITPIISEEGTKYQCSEEIVIRPYPNPIMWGGMWGGRIAHTREEIKAVIKDFNLWVVRAKEYGLEKVEIKEMPEVTQAEYDYQRGQAYQKAMRKTSNPKAQLSLM